MSNLLITLGARDMMSRKLGKASQAVTGLTRRFTGLRGVMGPALASFTGFALGSSFIQANASLEKMTLQLEAMTGSSEAAAKSMDFIRKFQDEFPVTDIETLTDAYKDLVAGGINPTTGALKSLVAGSTKFGLTAADIKGVTRALKQTTAVTNAQKQELNQLAERIPGIQRMVAEEMGKSTDTFLKEMERRQLKSNEVAAATLRALGRDSDEVLEKFAGSWQATISKIKTAWFNLMTRLGETGTFDKIKKIIDNVAEFIKNRTDAIVSVWSQMQFIIVGIFHELKKTIVDVFSGNDIHLSIDGFFEMIIMGWGELKKASLDWIESLKKGLNIVISGINSLMSASSVFKPLMLSASEKKELADQEASLRRFRKFLKDEQFYSHGEKKPDFLIDEEDVKEAKREIDIIEKKIKLLKGSFEPIKFFDDRNVDDAKARIDEETQARLQGLKKVQDKNKVIIKEMAALSKKSLTDLQVDNSLLGTEVDQSEGKEKPADTFLSGWTKALDALKDKSKGTFDSITAIGERTAEATTRAFETGLTHLFDNVIDGKVTRFKDLMLNLVKDIAKALARLAAQQAAQGLAQTFANAFSGGGGITYGDGTGGTTASGGANTSASLNKASSNAALRQKASSQSNMKIEIVNNSGELLKATETQYRQEFGQQIMSIVLDSVRTNRNGSRDSLRAGLA